MTAELWLAICGSCGAADVFRVRPGKNVVGRTERCDIRLLYRSVSRQHAVIEYSGGEFSLRDLGSTNGTFLNGANGDMQMGISPISSPTPKEGGRL